MLKNFKGGAILLLACVLLLNSCAAQAAKKTETVNFPVSDAPVKIIVASDAHIFPAGLHDDSDAYKKFEASGQGKMLTFSDEIADAFVNDALLEKPDAVILTGDLTLNGEKLGHEAMAVHLKKLTDAGVQVFVIPGNHDINNPNARIIRDGKFYRTDYTSPERFEEIYAGLRSSEVLYRADGSLSYIARLNDFLYMVMLDTCVYEPNIGKNISIMGGTLDRSALDWLEKSVKEIITENPDAKFVTAMHHNLLQHHPGFDENYIIQSQDTALPLFAELGLSLTFTGHIHSQDILTDESGVSPVTEISNGCLAIFPFDYGVLELTKTGGSYYTKAINMIRGAADYDFAAFSNAIFERRITRRRRNDVFSEEDAQAARDCLTKIQTGDSADIKTDRGYQVLVDLGMERGFLDYIFDGESAETNNFEFEW